MLFREFSSIYQMNENAKIASNFSKGDTASR